MTRAQIMQMNKEELRVAVAEAFGWRPLGRISTGQLLGRNNKYGGWKCVPDYTSDLNACHEMEEWLFNSRPETGADLFSQGDPW